MFGGVHQVFFSPILGLTTVPLFLARRLIFCWIPSWQFIIFTLCCFNSFTFPKTGHHFQIEVRTCKAHQGWSHLYYWGEGALLWDGPWEGQQALSRRREAGYKLMCKNIVGSEDDHRLISSRRFFWCTFVDGLIAGTGGEWLLLVLIHS